MLIASFFTEVESSVSRASSIDYGGTVDSDGIRTIPTPRIKAGKMARRPTAGNPLQTFELVVLKALTSFPFPGNLIAACIVLYFAVIVAVIAVVVIAVMFLSIAVIHFAKYLLELRRDRIRFAGFNTVVSPSLRRFLESNSPSRPLPEILLDLQQCAGDNVDVKALNEFLACIGKYSDALTLGDLYHALGRDELNRQTVARVAGAKAMLIQGTIDIRLFAMTRWLRAVPYFQNSIVRAWLQFWSMTFAALLIIGGFFFWYETERQTRKANAELQSLITESERWLECGTLSEVEPIIGRLNAQITNKNLRPPTTISELLSKVDQRRSMLIAGASPTRK